MMRAEEGGEISLSAKQPCPAKETSTQTTKPEGGAVSLGLMMKEKCKLPEMKRMAGQPHTINSVN
jgi:hypothetical protein